MFEQEQKKSQQGLSTEVLYKIEVPANRYDLLCIEGFALSLRTFLGKAPMPNFQLNGQPKHKLVISESVKNVRPIALAAILRNIKFNDTNYLNQLTLRF